MKASVLGLAVASAAFAASSLYFWQQLESERESAARVAETTRQLTARIAELESARARLAETRTAAVSAPQTRVFGELTQTGPAPGEPAEADKGNKVWTVNRVEPSPAMQKMMRNQARVRNKRLYAGVSDQLGLSKEKAEKLIDLLTDQQVAGFGGLPEFKDPADAERYFQEHQRAHEQAISDLIGPDKALALKEYQETLPTRFEVENLARQLADQDAPLSEAQSKQLLDVLLTERKRVPEPEFVSGMDEKEYAKAANVWKDDYDRRVADEASRILNAEQLTAYGEIQQWQKDMREQMAAQGIVMPPAGPARRIVGSGNAVTFTAAAPAFISGTVVNAGVAETDKKEKKP